jgi:hypothetical protein
MGVKSDLLDRVVLIQKAVTGIVDAEPRFWVPDIASNAALRFLNKIERITPNGPAGTGWRKETVRVTMRLLVGAIGTDYNVQETDLNDLYDTVDAAFFLRPVLQHPTTDEALRYCEDATIVDVIGARELQFTATVAVVAADFTLEVKQLVPNPRKG